MKLSAAIPFLFILASCAQLPEPWPDSESGMKLANMTYIAPDATPDEASIHRVFYAAYSRTRVGLLGGEDLEAIHAGLKDLRTRLGDRDFAAALEKEDPAVRSGVGYFCGEVTRENFPLTRAVLDKTPNYKFELEKADESM
jgi:hypothetical protein